jgi:hypothetical protein
MCINQSDKNQLIMLETYIKGLVETQRDSRTKKL